VGQAAAHGNREKLGRRSEDDEEGAADGEGQRADGTSSRRMAMSAAVAVAPEDVAGSLLTGRENRTSVPRSRRGGRDGAVALGCSGEGEDGERGPGEQRGEEDRDVIPEGLHVHQGTGGEREKVCTMKKSWMRPSVAA